MWTHLPSTLSAEPEKTIDLGPLAEAHLDSLPKTKIVIDNTQNASELTSHEVFIPTSNDVESRFLTDRGQLCPYFKESHFNWWVRVPSVPSVGKTIIYGIGDGTCPERDRRSDFTFLEHFAGMANPTQPRGLYGNWEGSGVDNLGEWTHSYNYAGGLIPHIGSVYIYPWVTSSTTATVYSNYTGSSISWPGVGTGYCIRVCMSLLFDSRTGQTAATSHTATVTYGPHTIGVSGTKTSEVWTSVLKYQSNEISGSSFTQPRDILPRSMVLESGHYNGKRYGRGKYNPNTHGSIIDSLNFNYGAYMNELFFDTRNMPVFSTVDEAAPSIENSVAINTSEYDAGKACDPRYFVDFIFVRKFIYPEPVALIAGGG